MTQFDKELINGHIKSLELFFPIWKKLHDPWYAVLHTSHIVARLRSRHEEMVGSATYALSERVFS